MWKGVIYMTIHVKCVKVIRNSVRMEVNCYFVDCIGFRVFEFAREVQLTSLVKTNFLTFKN